MVQIITTERVVTDKGGEKSANKTTDGILRGQVYVGQGLSGAYVLIDGENNRLVVSDGTTIRIVIGNV